jgi:hypothetical protein
MHGGIDADTVSSWREGNGVQANCDTLKGLGRLATDRSWLMTPKEEEV